MTRENVRTLEDARDYLEFIETEQINLETEYETLLETMAATGRTGSTIQWYEELDDKMVGLEEEENWVTALIESSSSFPPEDPFLKTRNSVKESYKVVHDTPSITGPEPYTDVIPDYLK